MGYPDQNIRFLTGVAFSRHIGFPSHEKTAWCRSDEGAIVEKAAVDELVGIEGKDISGSITISTAKEGVDVVLLEVPRFWALPNVDRKALIPQGIQYLEGAVDATVVDKGHVVKVLKIVPDHCLDDVRFVFHDTYGDRAQRDLDLSNNAVMRLIFVGSGRSGAGSIMRLGCGSSSMPSRYKFSRDETLT